MGGGGGGGIALTSQDLGLKSSEEVGEEGRASFLRSLPASPVAATKGIKCSYKKWMSVLDTVEYGDAHNSTKMLLLLYLGLQKGWIESYEDLWEPSKCPKIIQSMAKAFGGNTAEKRKRGGRAEAPGGGSGALASAAAPGATGSAAASSSSSAAAAPAKGGEEDKEARKGAANTLHVVLRLLANPDEEAKSRVALMAADAVRMAHKKDIRDVRSAASTRDFYAKMSLWGFMGELKGVVQSLQNFSKMEGLGMTTEFPPSLLAMSITAPKVKHDDLMAELVWRLVKSILKFRGMSCLWFVSSCPGMWGAFLSADGADRQIAMDRFKEHWEAYSVCKSSNLLALKAAAERHPCNSRCAHDMARLCKSAGWQTDARVQERAKLIFEGIGQENFLENCMKACREVEVKQGSSKQHRTFRYWEAAHQANLFGGNERVELKPSENHDPVPSNLLDNIFQPRVGVDDALRIADIMKAKFYSPNVASEKESWLEAELVRRLHSLGQLSALTDAWISSLFPESQVCAIQKEDGSHDVFFTLAVSRYGILSWPVERIQSEFVRLAPDATQLRFDFVFDVEKAYVLPTVCCSPLQGFLSKTVPGNKLACLVRLDGSAQKLLKWQTGHGFVGVREDSLRKLSERLELPIDSASIGEDCDMETDAKTSLCLGIMRHQEPTLSEVDALSRLQSAISNDPNCESGVDTSMLDSDILDGDVLEDLLCVDDRKDFKESKKTAEKVVKEVKRKRVAMVAIVKKSFELAPASKAKAKIATTKKVSVVDMDRWWAATKGDDRFINKYIPASARVFTDNPNGRFLLMQHELGHDRKSFSWTKRGNQKASLMLLQVAWERHIAAYGGESPLPAVLFENVAM